jgi:hypothetical protein
VSIIGGTGDWTGGWDCSSRGSVDRFITPDLRAGRMVELIDRGDPAVIVSHWTGIYFNGEEVGFGVFQEVVRRLHARYDHLIWMKNSEIARYWAARTLTAIERAGDTTTLRAPFACPAFTLRVPAPAEAVPRLTATGAPAPLREVSGPLRLEAGAWCRDGDGAIVCFDLPKGTSVLKLAVVGG